MVDWDFEPLLEWKENGFWSFGLDTKTLGRLEIGAYRYLDDISKDARGGCELFMNTLETVPALQIRWYKRLTSNVQSRLGL